MARATEAQRRDDFALAITRTLEAPRVLVYKAWSEPEHMMRWWGPKDFDVLSAAVDLHPGGAWRTVIAAPDGSEYRASGIYREIIENELLVFTFKWESDDAIDSLVTVRFSDSAGKTVLDFHQAPFASAESRDSHLGGWSESFDRLEAYVERL